MRRILIALAVLALLYLGVTYYFSSLILDTPHRDIETVYRMNRERWNLDLDSLVNTLPDKREVSFETFDGLTLRGWFFAPENADCGVIFAHGYSVNRANMLKYTPIFRDCNCAMLLYDHRGHGDSDEAYGSGGEHESTDLLTATDWFREETGLDTDQIGWYGESWGGATVLQALPKTDAPPAWVVAESPYADWETAVMERGLKTYGNGIKVLTPGAFAWAGLRGDFDFGKISVEEAVRELETPVLLFHSAADTLTSHDQGARIAAAAPERYLTYHELDWGAWHAHNVIWRPEEYRRLVLDFVGDWCPQRQSPPGRQSHLGGAPALRGAPPRRID